MMHTQSFATRSLALALGAVLLSPGCGDVEPPDDAGDVAFVQQVVPAVLGRKVRGSVELNVLTQLVEDEGRDALLDVLFQQPEYYSYWQSVFQTRLQVNQTGTFAESGTCFDNRVVMTSDDPVAAQGLVDHLRYDAASTSYSAAFTMYDAIRAGLVADDLSGMYRVYLLPLAKDQFNADWTDWQYQTAVLGRNPDCQGCHSTAWSTTDDAEWDRFWPTPLNIERTLYGSGVDLTAACGSDWACQQVHGSGGECTGCHGSDGTDDLTSYDGRSKTLNTRIPVLSYGQTLATIRNGSPGGYMPDLGLTDDESNGILWYLEGTLGHPYGLTEFVRTDAITAGTQPLGMSSACAPPVNNTYAATVYPSWFAGQRPTKPSPNDVLDAYKNGLSGVLGEVTSTGLDYSTHSWEAPHLTGPAAFAWAAAAKSVDTVAQEILGGGYTLSHGYHRNGWQALNHDVLTVQFIQSGWSLQEAIRTLVMSNHFNRRAPSDSLVTSTAYPLLPVVNPWASPQPGTGTGAPGEDRNGTGDLVHRYSPDNLYHTLADGLGIWQINDEATVQVQYPPTSLQAGIGDYVEYYSPGTDRWSTTGLLYWESWHGYCTAGDYAYGDVGDYTQDVLSAAVSGGYTYRQAFSALRDRLMADPAFTPEEETDLAALIAPTPLDGTVGAAGMDALNTWLAHYCGALIKTPDYLLAGVAPVTVATNTFPTITVCHGYQPCGIHEVCTYWEGELSDQGVSWGCDETPGSGPDVPVEWDENVVAERELADDWGFDWENDYAAESADEAKRQAAEASLPTREEPMSAAERAWVNKYNMSLRESSRYWASANAEAEREAAMASRGTAVAATLAFADPEWSGEVSPTLVSEAAARQTLLERITTASDRCRRSGHVECPTASMSEVTSTSTGTEARVTQEVVDQTAEAAQASIERAERAAHVSDSGTTQPEMPIEPVR